MGTSGVGAILSLGYGMYKIYQVIKKHYKFVWQEEFVLSNK